MVEYDHRSLRISVLIFAIFATHTVVNIMWFLSSPRQFEKRVNCLLDKAFNCNGDMQFRRRSERQQQQQHR